MDTKNSKHKKTRPAELQGGFSLIPNGIGLTYGTEAGTENRPHNIDLKRILVIRFVRVAPYVAPDISAAFWDSNPHNQAKKYFLILIERALN